MSTSKRPAPDWPAGPYGVILADPPWRYRNTENGAAGRHYDTMTDKEVAALPVGACAAAGVRG